MAQYPRLMIVSSLVLAIGLAGCGGGGGGSSIVSTPPPPPPPLPPPPQSPSIVTAATSSQEFATKGASYTSPSATYGRLVVSSPSMADDAQLNVRYNAASRTYEIQLPADSVWQPIALQASYPSDPNLFLYRAGSPDHVGVFDHRSNLQHSALLEWFSDTASGYSAIGIATLPGSVPITGSASYTGSILGASSETTFNTWEAVWFPGTITGAINLSFNFGSGSLSGNINPTLYLDYTSYTLPSLSFTNTVYSSGSTEFFGAFATALSGRNSFSGLFTGPRAEELIGNFAFPYASPKDGATEQAAGAFVGRRN